MEQKVMDYAALILLFTPVFSAIAKIIIKFSMFDFIYLVLAALIFLRCYIKSRKRI